jgi:Tol biopolymer transport system component
MVGGCAISALQQLQPRWWSFWSYYAVSPNGKGIYIVKNGRGFGGIYLYDPHGTVTRPVIDTNDQERDVSVSPDGRFLTYVSVVRDESGRLSISNADGTGARQLTSESSTCAAVPIFSPDGKSILFARAVHRHEYAFGGHMVWDTWDVCAVPVSGGPVKQLTNSGYFKMHRLSVSRGGKKIVYTAEPRSSKSADDELFAIPLNGGNPQSIGPVGAFDAGLSPDGSRITYIKVFKGLAPFRYDVWISDYKGTNARQLTQGLICQQPSFSADGKSIYYLASAHRVSYDLHSLDLATRKDTVIIQGTVFDEPPR